MLPQVPPESSGLIQHLAKRHFLGSKVNPTQPSAQADTELMLRELSMVLGNPALLFSCRADLLVETLNAP